MGGHKYAIGTGIGKAMLTVLRLAGDEGLVHFASALSSDWLASELGRWPGSLLSQEMSH
ncbi:MAG: hypothetical protein ACREOJ_04555 [Gemmatimonadaceae bacterium]